MPHTERHRILDELNRLRRVISSGAMEATSVSRYFSPGQQRVMQDDLTHPLTPDVVDRLIEETVNEIMSNPLAPQGIRAREAITAEVERMLMTDGRTSGALLELGEDTSDFSVAIQSVVDEQNVHLRTFPDAPTLGMKLRRVILALETEETNNPGSTGITPAISDALTEPGTAGLSNAELVKAREFVEGLDVDAFYALARSAQADFDPTGQFRERPLDIRTSLRAAISTFNQDDIENGDTLIPTTLLPPEPTNVTGRDAVEGRLQQDNTGFVTEASIRKAVDEALRFAEVKFNNFPNTEAGKAKSKAVAAVREDLVESALQDAAASRNNLDDTALVGQLSRLIEEGVGQFDERVAEQEQIAADEIQRVEEAKTAEDLANLGEDKSASDEALKDALHSADPLASFDNISPSFLAQLRTKVENGEALTPREVIAARTSFERDERNKKLAEDAAEAQAQADTVATKIAADAISEDNVLRALQDAGYGTAMGTTEYDQFIRQFLPRISNQLDLIREQNPTVTLDVVALLKGNKDIWIDGELGTSEGILADIEGFQTPEEFTAEKLRVASPDDALRIRQDLDKIQEEERLLDESRLPQLPVPFQTDDDPNIFGDEQIGADLLPPGVPGLPTLDDTGVISSSALAAQREKALQLEIPDFGEIQDLVAKLSGGNPELQEFIFENLDLNAIKKSGRDEAARRRQEAFEDAARLSETPEPFVMPDVDPSRLPTGSMARLQAQSEQRSTTPVLTGAQSGRFADRPLPKVKFAPLVEEQLPELTRQFEQSPTQVASRQRKAEVLKEDEKREAELLTARRESKALRGSRTVFSRRARR